MKDIKKKQIKPKYRSKGKVKDNIRKAGNTGANIVRQNTEDITGKGDRPEDQATEDLTGTAEKNIRQLKNTAKKAYSSADKRSRNNKNRDNADENDDVRYPSDKGIKNKRDKVPGSTGHKENKEIKREEKARKNAASKKRTAEAIRDMEIRASEGIRNGAKITGKTIRNGASSSSGPIILMAVLLVICVAIFSFMLFGVYLHDDSSGEYVSAVSLSIEKEFSDRINELTKGYNEDEITVTGEHASLDLVKAVAYVRSIDEISDTGSITGDMMRKVFWDMTDIQITEKTEERIILKVSSADVEEISSIYGLSDYQKHLIISIYMSE